MSNPSHRPHSSSARLAPAAAALAIGVLAPLGGAACASLGGRSTARIPIEVRNTLDTAFNLYVLPNARGERFVGQVGPNLTRTVQLRLARGDTVRLRARAIADGQEHVAYPVVVDSGTVWRIP